MKQRTEQEKKVLLDLAAQCAWADPSNRPVKKSWWRAKKDWWSTVVIKPTDIMLVALTLITLAMFYVSMVNQWMWWHIVAVYVFFTTLILWGRRSSKD